MPKYIDITNRRFGRLVAIEKAERGSSNKEQWLCHCDCGNFRVIRKQALMDGMTRSCGCLNDEQREINLDQTGRKHTEESKAKMSKASLGRKRTPEAIEKSNRANRGRKNGERQLANLRASFTEERLAKLREAWSGPTNPGYIDGKGAERIGEHRAALGTAAYRRWRQAVYVRDDYTCQLCDVRGGNLHADHILPFSSYPELRYELSNGRTLCAECHRKTPTYGSRPRKKALQALGLVKQS